MVIGIDGSGASKEALAFGFGYAAAHSLPVAAVHVTSGAGGGYWVDEQELDYHVVDEPYVETLFADEVAAWSRRYPDYRPPACACVLASPSTHPHDRSAWYGVARESSFDVTFAHLASNLMTSGMARRDLRPFATGTAGIRMSIRAGAT